jgi:type I restriction enzyme S subunit
VGNNKPAIEFKHMQHLLDGVEVVWRPLGDVIRLEIGKQLNKEFFVKNGHYPVYNGGATLSGYTDTYNYNENTIIISQGGAAGFVNFVTSKFYANAHCYVVLPNISVIDNRFVYHFLKLNQEKLMNKQHGAVISALRKKEILEIIIPIPPLHVQEEIVRILDTFTELTAELTTELTALKKQYNYYRDKLLTFGDYV